MVQHLLTPRRPELQSSLFDDKAISTVQHNTESNVFLYRSVGVPGSARALPARYRFPCVQKPLQKGFPGFPTPRRRWR